MICVCGHHKHSHQTMMNGDKRWCKRWVPRTMAADGLVWTANWGRRWCGCREYRENPVGIEGNQLVAKQSGVVTRIGHGGKYVEIKWEGGLTTRGWADHDASEVIE